MTTASPFTAPRGIDHIVIAARDLAQLAAQYRALGFQVGPKNIHPWGTENHIVQFDGAFIELIGVGDASRIPPHAAGQFSFGAFIRDYLAKWPAGGAMLALESRDAVADTAAFAAAHIGDCAPFHFERSGIGKDGQPVTVGFSLAFANRVNGATAGFFACQQHHPQNFWNAERQVHPNGVSGIASLIFVAEDPSDYHEFFGHFINQREMRATSFGLELDTGRGLVEVLTEEAFAYRFGAKPRIKPTQGLSMAALQIRAKSPAEIPLARQVSGTAIVTADAAGGLLLAFATQ